MADLVSQTSVKDWNYIAEGGSSIVFAYIGSTHAALSHKVLRLRKSPIKTYDDFAVAPLLNDLDDPAIAFQQTVIQRLVPHDYLPQLQIVSIDREWLRHLADASERSRPEARQAVDRIDLNRETAVLADNVVGGSGLAVEIKPKWGFLPSPDYLSPGSRPIKTQTCRFCMHAHMKGSAERDVPLDFCPLDLYSGDAHRVRLALAALWEAWVRTDGSINNLRIFVDGHVLKPKSDIALLRSLLVPSATASPALSMDELGAPFVDALLPILMSTPVLRLLSFLQRTLDPLDIEGLSALWARIHASDDSASPFVHDEDAVEPSLDEWSRFVDAYLANGETRAGVWEAAQGADHAELRYSCLAYLLSATFKDCSLVVRSVSGPGSLRLDEVDALQAHVGQEDTPGHPLAASGAEVKLIDLDVKSIKRLAKWERLDREIVTAYTGVKAPRTCVDSLSRVHFAPK